MLAYNVKPWMQSQTLYQVLNAMLIRLVFKAPFGIESRSFKCKRNTYAAFTSIRGIHSQFWYSEASLGSNPKLYLTLQCNICLVFNSSFGIESQSFKLNLI